MLDKLMNLLERGIVALETLAGNGTPLLPAADAPAPAARGRKKTAPAAEDKDDAGEDSTPAAKKSAPKVDYDAIRGECTALIRKLAEAGSADAVKGIIKKAGQAARLGEVEDGNLQAVLDALKELEEML